MYGDIRHFQVCRLDIQVTPAAFFPGVWCDPCFVCPRRIPTHPFMLLLFLVRCLDAIEHLWPWGIALHSFLPTFPPLQAQTAPHLYRLAVALTVIYYALLFLPLACFCLIVCCLPLFIVLYRLALPYAEREWRRARSADEAQLAALPSTPYTPGMLSSLASDSGSATVAGGGPATATTTTPTTTTPSAAVTVADGGIVTAAAAGAAEEEDDEATCVICLCEYVTGELVTFLPCRHHFHQRCINEWLVTDKSCPLCKQDIDAGAVAAAAAASAAARADASEQEAAGGSTTAGGGATRLVIGSPSGASLRGVREDGGSSGREDERLASQV